jgi:hypothetical protein
LHCIRSLSSVNLHLDSKIFQKSKRFCCCKKNKTVVSCPKRFRMCLIFTGLMFDCRLVSIFQTIICFFEPLCSPKFDFTSYSYYWCIMCDNGEYAGNYLQGRQRTAVKIFRQTRKPNNGYSTEKPILQMTKNTNDT